MRYVAVLLFSLLISSTSGTAAAEELVPQGNYKPGSFVVVVRRADLKVENRVVDTAEEGLLLGVDRVEKNWLWVTNKKSGWLHSDNVMPAEKAVGYFSAAIERTPKDARLFARRGLARALNHDFDAALKDYNEALRLNPAEAVYYGDRGCIFLVLGNFDQAIADFKEELKRINSEEQTKRAVRSEWLEERLADAQSLKGPDTTVTLGDPK